MGSLVTLRRKLKKKPPKKGFLGLSGATMGGFTKHKKLAEYNPFAFF